MKLKFWQRQAADPGAPRMSKPKEIPDAIGRYLVVTLKQEPDFAWRLMYVSWERPDSAGVSDILIFSPERATHLGLHVVDYASLTQQASLILFKGWFDKGRGTFEIRPTDQMAPGPTAA